MIQLSDGFFHDSADYREAFGLFDRVGDNKVAYNQIADIMRALGQNPTNKEVTKILGNPSTDGKKLWVKIYLMIPHARISAFDFKKNN